ncbi:hypothetical protein D3C84_608660 [compost metagenome]
MNDDQIAVLHVEPDNARHPVAIREQPCRHDPIDDFTAHPLHLLRQNKLQIACLRHRQHISPLPVNAVYLKITVRVLLEVYAPRIQLLHDFVAFAGLTENCLLVNDPVVGFGNLPRVFLRRRFARDNRIIQPVHPHADSAASPNICFIQHQHAERRIGLLRLDRRHRPRRSPAYNDDIGCVCSRLHT